MTLGLQPLDMNPAGWDKTTKELTNAEGGLVDPKPSFGMPLSSLTTEALDGIGVFDALMRTTKLHLQQEYDAQRITGKEYTTVYLGALTAVLQTSVQFLMNAQQVNLLNAQIGLVRQQTVTELSNTCDSIPEGLGFNYVPDVTTPIDPLVSLEGAAAWL
jgi:hypothetical protein